MLKQAFSDYGGSIRESWRAAWVTFFAAVGAGLGPHALALAMGSALVMGIYDYAKPTLKQFLPWWP